MVGQIDERRADDAVKFFERVLTHTKGIYAGKPFILADWQKAHIRELFGRIGPDGLRQYTTSYWSVGKKNGKTEIAAGVLLYGFLWDDEPGNECYSVAATRDQASIVFRIVAQMIRNSPILRSMCRIIDSTKTIIRTDHPDRFYRALSADANSADGINPHFVIFDELHRQRGPRGRDLWDVVKKSSATRAQPLLFAISTAGIQADSPICWEQHEYSQNLIKGVFRDATYYPVIYSLPEDADWTDESKWSLPNPALGDFKKLSAMQEEFERAKRIPAQQNSFRRFELNQWVSQESRWIDLTEWDANGSAFLREELHGRDCFAGLDLSTNLDVTALVLVFPPKNLDDEDESEPYYLVSEFWLPKDDIVERSIRDNVTWDRWARRGHLNLTEGNVIDFRAIRRRINELAEDFHICEIGYDQWNAAQMALELQDDGFTMVPIRQTFHSLCAPSQAFERLIMKRRLRHGGHPLLRWMMDCTSIRTDTRTGYIRPVKPERKKTSKRIDGIVATIMGLDRCIRHEPVKSVYDERDVRWLG